MRASTSSATASSSKTGFSTYVNERFSGFDGRSRVPGRRRRRLPQPGDAAVQHAGDGARRVLQLRRSGRARQGPQRRCTTSRPAQGARSAAPTPSTAFIGAISPGQIAFNYPDQHYGSHEEYLGALADALSYEYKAITDAGFNLQIDSPDLAMAAHCRSVGQQRRRLGHPPAAGDRGAQRGARRDPAGAGPPPRLLGQLRRSASQGRAARRRSSARC